ncbi:MAG: FRG domain-containing protein [Bryobacteraceae bacterium]
MEADSQNPGPPVASGFATLDSVTVQKARSVDEYLAVVKTFRQQWRVPRHDELWFRAEDSRHQKTHLQPGIYRPREGGKRRAIKFLLEVENDLYEEFERCATQLSDVTPGEDWEWEWYFLMQHHGVPTRLLDWSDGALIALHFAVRDKTHPPTSGSVIYVLEPYTLVKQLERHPDREDAIDRWKQFCKTDPHLDPDDWDRLYLPTDKEDSRNPLLVTPQIPLLWDSPHVSRRVAAQRSRFMIFGSDPSWLANLAKVKDSKLKSIRIPAGSINGIRRQLRDAGVTESVVYPDLDGLGRELKQRWQERR